jgi:hypothetical protein
MLTAQTGFITGKVTDSISGRGVPFIQVYNESSKTYTATDSLGRFRMRGLIKDTLVVYSMNFFGKIWIVNDFKQNLIPLKRQLFEIDPVVISVPRDYKQFKKKFLEIEPVKPMVIDGFSRYIPKRIPDLLDTNKLKKIFNPDNGTIAISITKIYNLYSKEEQSKRKVLYLQQEERELVIINQKYNPSIVQRLTNLKDEELTDFILFCHFTHQYLYEASEYEIVEAISRKLIEFKQLDKKSQNP